MRKQTRSSHALAIKRQTPNFDIGVNSNNSIDNNNKRGNSAKGYSLLPLALRPRLFGISIAIGAIAIIGANLNLSNNQVSAVSATLSIPDNVSVNVNPTLNDGFAESTPGAVSVSTSNLAGYTLSIKSKNNNDLVNELDSNAKLTSITTELSTEQYKTGDYANTWGFKPDYVDSSPNTSYLPGPTSSGITLAKTNSDSALDNINLAIAAKVDSNAITGNYTNTFVLTAVPNEAFYDITYNNNGGSGGPSSVQHGEIGSSTYVEINKEEVPTLSGKDFLGWCSVNPGTGDTCNGVLVQPGGQFPLCKCDLSITLYAMYGKKVNIGTSNGSDCMVNSYLVGKIYSGYCWMWENVSNTYLWAQAKTACPTGTHLPTSSEFSALVTAIGSGNQLYNAGWTAGNYWSSTEYARGSAYAYYLHVSTNNAYVASYSASDQGQEGIKNSKYYYVRCVAGES